MTRRKIIIDTDPGVDDALALFLAVASPELELIGVTTTFGNVKTPEATRNALRLLEVAGEPSIPVNTGSQTPLYLSLSQIGIGYFVNGQDGLGNTHQPIAAKQATGHDAARFIIDNILANPGEITLVSIAPLTNLAIALSLEPRIASLVKEVIIMGGSINMGGNVTPAAEANIINDPHAADRVLTAGWPVTLIGLDVTYKALMSTKYLQDMRDNLGAMGHFIWDISRVYSAFYKQILDVEGLYSHDSTALTYLLAPELFTIQQGAVRVPTEGIAMGQTILDKRGSWGTPNAWTNIPTINVCTDVKSNGILECYREKIKYFKS